jgi:hypothetical protein
MRLLLCDEIQLQILPFLWQSWEATGKSSAPAEAPFDRASFDQSGMTIPSSDRIVIPILRFSTGTAEYSNSD